MPERIMQHRRWLSWILLAVSCVLVIWQGTLIKQSEDARRAERLRLELILTTSPLAMVMCDENGKIIFSNPEAEKLFGWSYAELQGKPASILLPPEARKAHDTTMRHAVEHAKTYHPKPSNWAMRRAVKSKAMKKNGEIFDIELGIRTVKYANNIEFIATMRYPQSDFFKTEAIPIPDLEERIEESQERVQQSLK